MELNYGKKPHNHCVVPLKSNLAQCPPINVTRPVGGGRSYIFSASVITPYLSAAELQLDYSKTAFKFVNHVDSTGLCLYPEQKGFVHVKMPLTDLVPNLTTAMTRQIAKIHNIHFGSHENKAQQAQYFDCHDCVACNLFTSVFEPVLTAKAKDQQRRQSNKACWATTLKA
jgi:hypothetical protein